MKIKLGVIVASCLIPFAVSASDIRQISWDDLKPLHGYSQDEIDDFVLRSDLELKSKSLTRRTFGENRARSEYSLYTNEGGEWALFKKMNATDRSDFLAGGVYHENIFKNHGKYARDQFTSHDHCEDSIRSMAFHTEYNPVFIGINDYKDTGDEYNIMRLFTGVGDSRVIDSSHGYVIQQNADGKCQNIGQFVGLQLMNNS
jgi:hypothetical protein